MAMASKPLRGTSASNCSTSSQPCSINDLLDDLLIEIFCRLPCHQVFISKCVSKRWFILISNPKFHCLYLSRQRISYVEEEEKDQQSFIINPYNALVIIPKVPSLEMKSLENQLSLSFLGRDFEPGDIKPEFNSVLQCVLGCSNGLLLCGRLRARCRCKFYVCNPLTKDCLELPEAPTPCSNGGTLVGFTCDPYYQVEPNMISINSQRRFKVVRIPAFTEIKVSFCVDIFSSDTFQWRELVLSCPKGFACGFPLTALSVTDNAKLYFVYGGRILVYDPYRDEKVASVIDFPSDFGEAYGGCLGVSCGNLRISEFPSFDSQPASMRNYSGRVWELEDCDGERGEETWKLLHEFCLVAMVGPIFEELKAMQRGYGRVLAFHPHDRDIVFLEFGGHILSCNMITHNYKATKYNGLPLRFYPIMPIVLPWWPTPIPSKTSAVN